MLPEVAVLHRVARRLTNEFEDAADLVQQTLIRAFKGWERFDGSHLRSWLIKILMNEYRNHRRYRNARPSVDIEVEPTSECLWEESLWSLQTGRIRAEMDRLPMDYRLAIQLCEVEELTYSEAAEILGVPVGTVRSRLSRGKALLRQRLAPEFEEES